jgi:predicted aldo/keto reductase-like oxidoreductase
MDSLLQVEDNAKAADRPQHLTEDDMMELIQVKEKLGNNFCRRCDYCQPCPQSIDISTIFLLDGYLTRYALPEWAKHRYQALPVKVPACVDCGACEERCPYSLPIRQMLGEADTRLSD